MTKAELIVKTTLDILRTEKNGLRHRDLIRRLQTTLPDVELNTIRGGMWDIDRECPNEIYKPARGIFRHLNFKEETPTPAPTPEIQEAQEARESDFYAPFAQWLVQDMEDCTRAIPLGGNKFKDKWGTPDVIGIREPSRSDIVQFEAEIVAAEIKLDTNSLIVAFGQACSYKLFSHKAYLVIPRTSPEEDIARLDSLCLIFGIGLVLYDVTSPSQPDFEILTRPSRHTPEMFYVNKNLKIIEKELFA